MLDNPSQIPSFLAEALPSQAVFFICYIMLATLTGYALQLLRVVPLILVAIKRKWLVKTPREEALAWRPPPVLYDRVVSCYYLSLSYMLFPWSALRARFTILDSWSMVHDLRSSPACLHGIWDHDLWSNRLKYSRFRIYDAGSTIYDPLSRMQDLLSAIRDPRSVIRNPRSVIHNPWSATCDTWLRSISCDTWSRILNPQSIWDSKIYNPSAILIVSFSYLSSLPTICLFWLWACRTQPWRLSSLRSLLCTLGLVTSCGCTRHSAFTCLCTAAGEWCGQESLTGNDWQTQPLSKLSYGILSYFGHVQNYTFGFKETWK